MKQKKNLFKNLKMEREILKKGSSLLRERNELKYQFIKPVKVPREISLITSKCFITAEDGIFIVAI